MRSTRVLIVCVVLSCLPLPALGQQATGGSIIWLIPPAGSLDLDRELVGTLSASDFFGPDDIFIDVWELEGTAGAAVTVDMRSEDFDAYLYVVGPGLAETLWDDDGGGRCDARITVRFLEDGVYRVAATATGFGTTGVYSLTVSADPRPTSPLTCGGPDPADFALLPTTGSIALAGEPIDGSLDSIDPLLPDDAHAEVWEITGEAGRTVTIRLESDAFDAYLYVVGPGIDGVLTDDDSGGNFNAEIAFTFPADGTYRIIASSVEPGGTGAYRLTAR